MPAEMDVSNAAIIRERLLLLLNQGASVVVVDMTATTFCDCTGAGAVMRAYHRARASGAQVRLVSGGPLVRRIFALLGIGRVIEVYPSLAAAVAGQTGTRCAQSRDDPAEDCDQVPNGGG